MLVEDEVQLDGIHYGLGREIDLIAALDELIMRFGDLNKVQKGRAVNWAYQKYGLFSDEQRQQTKTP